MPFSTTSPFPMCRVPPAMDSTPSWAFAGEPWAVSSWAMVSRIIMINVFFMFFTFRDKDCVLSLCYLETRRALSLRF